MTVIDAQVHCFEADRPERPWTGPGGGLAEAPAGATVQLMNEHGVDRAVLVSPSLNYGTDPSYAFASAAAHPGRFSVVVPVDLSRQHPEQLLDDLAGQPDLAGLRHMIWTPELRAALLSDALEPLWTRLAAAGLPLCIATRGEFTEIAALAERHPDLTIVIDHLGLANRPVPPAPEAPFTDLDHLLALAALPNVAVKATGMPALSHDPYPFADLAAPLHRTIAEFGADRVLWGTDWTRVHAFSDYGQGATWVASAGLDASTLRAVRGENAQRVFGIR